MVTSLFIFSIVSLAQMPTQPETPPAVKKISQEKLEREVLELVKNGKANIFGMGGCGDDCKKSEAEPEIFYDNNDKPFVYEIPTPRKGKAFVWIMSEGNEGVFGHSYFGLPLANCQSFWDKVRQQKKPVRAGHSPYEMEISYGSVKMGTQEFDFIHQGCVYAEKETEYHLAEKSFQINSLFGPFVNMELFTSVDSGGGGKPGHIAEWVSWNMQQNRQSELEDVFETKALLEALKKDKVVQQRFYKGRKKELAELDDPKEIMKTIRTEKRQQHLQLGWQIKEYNSKTHMAKVHFGFYGECCNSTKIFKMGFELPVKEEWIDSLEMAKKDKLLNIGSGNLQSHFQNYSTKKKN